MRVRKGGCRIGSARFHCLAPSFPRAWPGNQGAWRGQQAFLDILRQADRIVQEELRSSGWYRKVWQGFAVLLPLRTVGVMGDDRSYKSTSLPCGLLTAWMP